MDRVVIPKTPETVAAIKRVLDPNDPAGKRRKLLPDGVRVRTLTREESIRRVLNRHAESLRKLAENGD